MDDEALVPVMAVCPRHGFTRHKAALRDNVIVCAACVAADLDEELRNEPIGDYLDGFVPPFDPADLPWQDAR